MTGIAGMLISQSTGLWNWFATWSGWLAGGSLLMFIASLWFVSWLIIRLPKDFFLTHDHGIRHSNPVIYVLLLISANGVGIFLITSGIAMLVLPGQGVITILLGLSLVSFPGKRRVIKWILARKSLRKTLNWVRVKAHKPPLEFDEQLPRLGLKSAPQSNSNG